MKKYLIQIKLIIIIVIALNGCIDQQTIENPDNMLIDVNLFITGHNETVIPEHKIITINKSSLETVNFLVKTNGAYNYSLLARSINVTGINKIECPLYFDSYIRNETGYIINYKEVVDINITISTKSNLPVNMQSVSIYYGSS